MTKRVRALDPPLSRRMTKEIELEGDEEIEVEGDEKIEVEDDERNRGGG